MRYFKTLLKLIKEFLSMCTIYFFEVLYCIFLMFLLQLERLSTIENMFFFTLVNLPILFLLNKIRKKYAFGLLILLIKILSIVLSLLLFIYEGFFIKEIFITASIIYILNIKVISYTRPSPCKL